MICTGVANSTRMRMLTKIRASREAVPLDATNGLDRNSSQ